ncbi:ATP-dependent acyl-CoA ligase [Peribacillus simplex]|uniref:ATP-dependent acyl-CoA ligase n=1 Tax=Peribacillus simplex TaxID=1478 RepID=UPI0011A8DA91|nr:ATP-dependent acyl-CoA ligase [Peribacillus simplex]
MKSIRELVERAVKKNPEKPFLWWQGENTSNIEMYRQIAKAANGFREIGIQRGDRIVLMLPNLPEFLHIWLGLNSIGASIVPINTFFKEEEAAYVINHSESILVVTYQDYYPLIKTILPRCPKIQELVVIQTEGELEIGIDYHSLVRRQSDELPVVDLDENDEASILYTSGTTGNPKGCVQLHSYYLIAGYRYAQNMNLTEQDCVITPLPLLHMNPQILSTMGTLWVGARLALVDRFHPRSWWDNVRKSGATKFHYLGVMPAMLMGQEETENDADHPHWIGMGGGVPSKLHGEFEKRFNVTLLEGFGMTECGLAICTNVDMERRIGTGCVGKVFPEYEVMVVDDDDQAVKSGEIGELVLRGSDSFDRRRGFMKEYYNNPEATEDVWKNGWFHTGDYVRTDDEGYVYFVDRKKDIVRRSGENISASEVEDSIRTHPNVFDVAVVAVPDEIREQEVKAYVIRHEGASVEMEDLIAWCEERLAYFKIPRYWELCNEFPVTNTGKIQKQKLRTKSEDLRINSYDRVDKIFRSKIQI